MRIQSIALLVTFELLASGFVDADAAGQTLPENPKAGSARYEIRKDHDPDGIGKFYMGREIAHVMGHQGAE